MWYALNRVVYISTVIPNSVYMMTVTATVCHTAHNMHNMCVAVSSVVFGISQFNIYITLCECEDDSRMSVGERVHGPIRGVHGPIGGFLSLPG